MSLSKEERSALRKELRGRSPFDLDVACIAERSADGQFYERFLHPTLRHVYASFEILKEGLERLWIYDPGGGGIIEIIHIRKATHYEYLMVESLDEAEAHNKDEHGRKVPPMH